MWTLIRKDNLQQYIAQYPNLSEHLDSAILLETNDALFLPRYLYKSYPSQLIEIYPGKKKIEPEKVNFKFTKDLRSEQVPITKTVLEIIRKDGSVNGIVKARPGIGKTVLTIYLAAKIGLKTCIIVDNSELMKQWIREIFKFTNLTDKDIGIIKQKALMIDKPISVAMVQTLLSKLKSNPKTAFDLIERGRFGLVVYDEVHATASATKFASSSILFRSENILGLSATPFQTGTAELLMKNTVGEIIYETKKYDLKPEFNFIYFDSKLTDMYSKKIGRVQDYLKKRAIYNSFIIESPYYLAVIADLVRKRLKDGHRTMILCFTKKQVTTISSVLESQGIENRRFYGDERDIDKINDQVLVATYAFAGKGFDFKELSHMILACPLAGKKSLIQSIGRILRSCEGKNSPIVDDLIDMAFASLFLPDVQTKKKIISDEFNCVINSIEEYMDIMKTANAQHIALETM